MININSIHFLYKSIGHDMSLISVKGDTSFFSKPEVYSFTSSRRWPVMVTSCIDYTSEVRTASCVIREPTSKGMSEVYSCMTLGQILYSGNLSEDQYYVTQRCIETERYEEELDDQLKDSMFIVFPSLEAFWFRDTIIRREDP